MLPERKEEKRAELDLKPAIALKPSNVKALVN